MTTLSMSALATNGKIPGGGPYAIVTKALGPEVGGAVGVLFYLGTTVAVTLYVLGGVEAAFVNFDLLTYVPIEGATGCENVSDSGIDYETKIRCFDVEGLFPFDQQILSIISTILLGSMVYVGMKFVSKISLVFLLIVFLAITMMTLGLLLMAAGTWSPEGVIPGSLQENLKPSYEEDLDTGVVPDYAFLLALFFPSTTGIMAGANRSGILRNPGKSIPKGTLGAISTTTLIYLASTWMFGCIIANETLKSNKLVASSVAWPHPIPVTVGIIMSCVGAALQSLAGAPQLLKSMANDKHIGFLSAFGTESEDAEPKRAIVFTTCIASVFCLAGNVNYITPIITMFFLAMYGTINVSCFISGYLKSPGFRPKWKYFHWSTALIGASMCLVLMFVISVLYAFIALILAGGMFVYIRNNKDVKEWGSAIVGFRLEQATTALLDLSEINFNIRLKQKSDTFVQKERRSKWYHRGRRSRAGLVTKENSELENGSGTEPQDPMSVSSLVSSGTFDHGWKKLRDQLLNNSNSNHLHGVNWRPQIMVLCKLKKETFEVSQPDLLKLAAQFKKGRGLIIAVSVLPGDVLSEEFAGEVFEAKLALRSQLAYHKVRGFAEVVAASGDSLLEPLRVLFQSSGIGPLQTNTVMLSWPTKWRDGDDQQKTAHKEIYVKLLKSALGCGKAIIVTKFSLKLADSRPQNLRSKMFNPLSISKRKILVSERPTIDVWWLIHDGGILVLLPYILQSHREWKECKMRIFAITPKDLVNQLKTEQTLRSYLENLRIEAEVKVVPVRIRDVKDIDQNRTVRIRNGVATPTGHASILSADLFRPNEVVEVDQIKVDLNDKRVKLRSSSFLSNRKLSTSKSLEDKKILDEELEGRLAKTIAALGSTNASESVKVWTNEFARRNSLASPRSPKSNGLAHLFKVPSSEQPLSPRLEENDNGDSLDTQEKRLPKQKTVSFHPTVDASFHRLPEQENGDLSENVQDGGNLEDGFKEVTTATPSTSSRLCKRLETAIRINEKIKEASSNASLVVMNLPLSRKTPRDEFVAYTEALTEGLSRVIMVRGNGHENVENFSI
eukprot:CAMPEP_0184007866 /NCGR_PEP_ID=MMETSP0954-20121128/1610_1 /TAXON_ID=627963 /ORGANISM="Aplanochytrium sp, Strain PBS07" /LENGTH=1067 /DNA_ID=CAMNT_0026286821 /DNA_START=619 /DNA_END=3822 /DNA_ORIENTATION=+